MGPDVGEMDQTRSKHVIVFGGGITGLTIAHECAEAGLAVTLYEREARLGGKAVSFRLPPGHEFAGVPVEHSLRNFQATYFSLFETMKRIPHARGGTAFTRLTPMQGLSIRSGAPGASKHIPSQTLDTSTTSSPIARMIGLYRNMRVWGLSRRDFASFLLMVLDYLTSDSVRQRTVIGSQTFAQYARLDTRSRAFQLYITSLAEISVAAKVHASAEVILDLFSRLLTSSFLNVHQVASFANVSDGPTHECLIDPWVDLLRSLSVKIHTGQGAAQITTDSEGTCSAILGNGEVVSADAIVLAIPHRAVLRVAPQLERSTGLSALRDEWSNGFQFFLAHLPQEFAGSRSFHMAYGSPWRLVFMFEGPPVWSADVALSGEIRAILSVTASQHNVPGVVYGKPLSACTWEEVQEELLTQIGFGERSAIRGAHPDPSLRYVSDEEYEKGAETVFADYEAQPANQHGYRWLSSTALCISTPESRQRQFSTQTAIKGLFMAGEFTDTINKTPNMEKANQAGKLCAQSIFESFGMSYPRTRLIAPAVPIQWAVRVRSKARQVFSRPV